MIDVCLKSLKVAEQLYRNTRGRDSIRGERASNLERLGRHAERLLKAQKNKTPNARCEISMYGGKALLRKD